jgi:hypothetical protein
MKNIVLVNHLNTLDPVYMNIKKSIFAVYRVAINTDTYLKVCDSRRGMDWILELLTTYIHHSKLHFTDH